jgi:hypothetical protein
MRGGCIEVRKPLTLCFHTAGQAVQLPEALQLFGMSQTRPHSRSGTGHPVHILGLLPASVRTKPRHSHRSLPADSESCRVTRNLRIDRASRALDNRRTILPSCCGFVSVADGGWSSLCSQRARARDMKVQAKFLGRFPVGTGAVHVPIAGVLPIHHSVHQPLRWPLGYSIRRSTQRPGRRQRSGVCLCLRAGLA